MTEPRSAPNYFIRNDDVGELDDGLRRFVDCFLERDLPVSHQIIPGRLTPECAHYLRELWIRHPLLVEFGQHGLHHEMIVRGRHLRREFGPERSRADQQRIIVQGRQRLRELLGDDVPVPVFTPPQHKYDGNTIRAVGAAGFGIFSAAAYPSLHHRMAYGFGRAFGLSSIGHQGISYHGAFRPEAAVAELSIAVAVDDGRSVRCPSGRLRSSARHSARYRAPVGFMFHHAVYAKQGNESQLFAIADQLGEMGADSFALLSTFAQDAGAGA